MVRFHESALRAVLSVLAQQRETHDLQSCKNDLAIAFMSIFFQGSQCLVKDDQDDFLPRTFDLSGISTECEVMRTAVVVMLALDFSKMSRHSCLCTAGRGLSELRPLTLRASIVGAGPGIGQHIDSPSIFALVRRRTTAVCSSQA